MIATSATSSAQNQQLTELYKALEMFKNNTNAQGCALKESSSQSSTLPSSPSTSESDFQGVKRKADSQNPEGATCKRSKQDDGERKDALGGPGGASFMRLLEQLEKDGIVKRHFGDVPKRLGGVCGWTVFDDKMDEWSKRRQAWFMEGKEGKTYKPNSLFQILRRLGFFPTESTKRASHGLDFEGSRTFAWDGSRHIKYVQSKAEQERNGRLFRGDKDLATTEIIESKKQTLPSIAHVEGKTETFMPALSANGIVHKSDMQFDDVKQAQSLDWNLRLQPSLAATQASNMLSQQILQLLQQQQQQQQQQQHLLLLSQHQQQQQYNNLLNGQGRIRIAALAPKSMDQWMPATLPSFESSLQ